MIDLVAYKKNGFHICKNFFPKDEVTKLKSDALYIFENQVKRLFPKLQSASELEKLTLLFQKDFDTFVSAGKHIQHMFSLHRLALSPLIESVIRELGISYPNICTRPVLYFNNKMLAKEDVYHTVFPHQDWRSMQGSINSIVCWVPLVDVDRDLGALEVVPGSHLNGLITDSVKHGFGEVNRFSDQDFMPVELKAGDALFFNSFLVHRSGRSTNDKIRWSCHFRYNDMDEKSFIERGYPHPYIYKPNDLLLTPHFDTQAALKALLV